MLWSVLVRSSDLACSLAYSCCWGYNLSNKKHGISTMLSSMSLGKSLRDVLYVCAVVCVMSQWMCCMSVR